MKRWLLVLGALMAGCGGGGGSPTQPTPTPSQPAVRTVLVAASGFVLPPKSATFKNVDFPPVGTLDATVDWTGGEDVNLYVTDSSCGSFLDVTGGRCPVLAKADGPAARPETVVFQTAANRVYSFWIHNNANSNVSGAMQVGITTSQPIPVPVPTPTPQGTPNPGAGLAPGPVARVVLYIRTIDTGNFTYREKFQDAQGRWVIHPGEFVVFDSTQKNANNEICVWINTPTYNVMDPQRVLRLRGSSQPFLLRTDVVGKGELSIVSSVDGVDSGVLRLISQ